MTDQDFKPQVEPKHYRASYETPRRFLGYWNQIDQIRRANPEQLLEVGIGNGFVSRYAREAGFSVHTVDFDARLKPDTVASVTELPFENGAFDVVCCFETLEHLPWAEFAPALGELRRVSRRRVLLSLPDVTPYVRLLFGVGFRSSWLDLAVDVCNPLARAHRFDGQHYWEIGKRGYHLRIVKRAIESSGLEVRQMHRDYTDPAHRFFVCAKAGQASVGA